MSDRPKGERGLGLSSEEYREVRAIRRAAASPAGRKARKLRNRQAHRDAHDKG